MYDSDDDCEPYMCKVVDTSDRDPRSLPDTSLSLDVSLCGGRLFQAFACHVVTCHFDDWENSYMLSVSPLTVTHGRFQIRFSQHPQVK